MKFPATVDTDNKWFKFQDIILGFLKLLFVDVTKRLQELTLHILSFYVLLYRVILKKFPTLGNPKRLKGKAKGKAKGKGEKERLRGKAKEMLKEKAKGKANEKAKGKAKRKW